MVYDSIQQVGAILRGSFILRTVTLTALPSTSTSNSLPHFGQTSCDFVPGADLLIRYPQWQQCVQNISLNIISSIFSPVVLCCFRVYDAPTPRPAWRPGEAALLVHESRHRHCLALVLCHVQITHERCGKDRALSEPATDRIHAVLQRLLLFALSGIVEHIQLHRLLFRHKIDPRIVNARTGLCHG